MKKLSILVVFVLFALFGSTVLARSQQIILPSAGLTPESSFYFFDKFGEVLQEFFTFNPEDKARLQIAFAAERIAEIKLIFETKGVEAKGIEVAQSRLQAHLANAATIVVEQESKGRDVSQLAKELDDEFEFSKTILEQTFKDQKRILETQEKELKLKILDAKLVGNTTEVKNLEQQLGQVKAQKELLELKEGEAEGALEQEEERIEEAMEAKEAAEKAIRDADEEKQDILDEGSKDDIAVPAELFTDFNSFLVKAKSAFDASDFVNAKLFAKQAEKSLDVVEEAIEKQKEAREKEEDLKEEQEEKERKVKEVKEEKTREKAEEESRKADEKLREVGKNEDEIDF